MIASVTPKLSTLLNSVWLQIGNTDLVKLIYPGNSLYAKLEFLNFSGSVKARAAYWMLKEAIARGEVNPQTTIVESSSGNMAIALASICKILQLRFIPVIDPNINRDYETLLKLLTPEVIKVSKRDSTGGYLLTRIEEVNRLCNTNSDIFWTNQYENPDNWKAYQYTMVDEIARQIDDLQYLFVAVSSGGTITGLSNGLKQYFPDMKVIAIDIEGSLIFQNQPKVRYISGLGSSKVPAIISEASIDDIMILTHQEIIQGSKDLLQDQALFAGASSGACYAAAKKYLQGMHGKKAIIICADRGNAYLDNVYTDGWLEMKESTVK
jgi:2,3-diaminopropionate biosynthesis protein SbnA